VTREGNNVAMMTLVLLASGINRLPHILAHMQLWMEEHEYTSIAQMRGPASFNLSVILLKNIIDLQVKLVIDP